MIVYRQQEDALEPAAALATLSQSISRAAGKRELSRDEGLHLLIEAGELAAAVADAAADDSVDPAANRLAALTVCLAGVAEAQWRPDGDITRSLHAADRAAVECLAVEMPRSATRRVSEGFAYYALDPAFYANVTRAWARESQPRTVWCLGLRTIGLTLAATVAATLQSEGADARLRSVRPTGHPFHRHLKFHSKLATELTSVREAWWIVVDEGPGLSGSSLASVAEALRALGCPDERIMLMPATQTDISRFAVDVRRCWQRHPVCAATESNHGDAKLRLARLWSADAIENVSGGAWRQHVPLAIMPGVHPQHERAKYRIQRGSRRTLLKFSGYGRYGEMAWQRAEAAADAGWAPRPLTRGEGWTEFPWVDAARCSDMFARSEPLQLAEYLAFVATTWPTDTAAAPEALVEMSLHNIGETCSPAAAKAFERLTVPTDIPAIRLDAHLRPHEWLQLGSRYLKTDGVDHHDDHFFPGPTDIAWDVAGVLEEWPIDGAAADYLVDKYARLTRDASIRQRLPFYRAAYLAFRAGYTAFCADQLQGSPEQARFHREHRRYRQRLQYLLES